MSSDTSGIVDIPEVGAAVAFTNESCVIWSRCCCREMASGGVAGVFRNELLVVVSLKDILRKDAVHCRVPKMVGELVAYINIRSVTAGIDTSTCILGKQPLGLIEGEPEGAPGMKAAVFFWEGGRDLSALRHHLIS
jgi:hypothetical protein